MSVTITLNGDPREVEDGLALSQLLESLRVRRERVVVEHNRSVLRGADLDGATLHPGDEVEVIQLVGGGC